MSVALLTSLVLALAFTPVLAERFVKAKPEDNVGPDEEEAHGRVLGAIIRRYESVLSVALDKKMDRRSHYRFGARGSYLLYRTLGSEFLPEFDESAFVLDYIAPAGSSLAETIACCRREELLLKTPEVESYSRRTGLEMGLFVTEPNTGDFALS
jgi:multidrug efflux pump subunit AcrB